MGCSSTGRNMPPATSRPHALDAAPRAGLDSLDSGPSGVSDEPLRLATSALRAPHDFESLPTAISQRARGPSERNVPELGAMRDER